MTLRCLLNRWRFILLNNDTYLVEAKWHSAKTGNADLHAFHGKLDQKTSWARGVFISWAGFTRSVLDAWGRGKKVICVSGYDLVLCSKTTLVLNVDGRKNTTSSRNGQLIRKD